MTPAQLQHVQIVLNAAVVNPVLEARADKLYRLAEERSVNELRDAILRLGSDASFEQKEQVYDAWVRRYGLEDMSKRREGPSEQSA